MVRAPALALGLCLMLTGAAVADDSLNVRFVGGWPCPGFTYSVALDSARDLVFVGAERGICVLDVGNPSSPVELSRTWTGDRVNGLGCQSGRLYVANDAAGLRIVSVADPMHPVELGYYDDAQFNALGVSVAGDHAYVAAGYQGLSVISVADPAHPSEVGRYDTPGSARSVAVSGENAYVADGDSGLRVISIADPSQPVEVGHCFIPNAAVAVAVSGGYAYVASDSFGLRVILVSDPTHPAEVGYCDTTPVLGRSVAVAGGYAYLARDTADVRIISIADPARPVEVGYCGTPGFAWGVAVLAGNAYVADYDGGLRVISVSDPARPVEIGSFDPPDGPWRVAVTGDHAYVADGPGGLLVISLADSARPGKVGQCSTPGYAYGVAVSGNYAYVATDSFGLRVVSVADAAHPVEVGHIDMPSRAWSVAVVGDLAYVADDTCGLHIVSAADPTQPTEVGYCDAPGGLRAVAVFGQYAYVAAYESGLRVISVADPAHPAETGHCNLPGRAFDVAVKGGYAYVADGSSGLRVVSIADPAHPVEVGFRDTLYAQGVALGRDYAYVADRDGGLRVLSVTDPTQPTEVGYYARLSAKSVVLNGGYAYVVSNWGLEILRFYGGGVEELGDIDVDPDSLDVLADTLRLRGSGSNAVGAFVLANTSAAYNPDTSDGPSLSRVDSLHFSCSLAGPGGTLDSILIPNLPASLLQGQTAICTLAVYVPPGLQDGDYTGSITVAGKDVNNVLVEATFCALATVHAPVGALGDLDIDGDSLDVTRDTMNLRTQPAGPVYHPYAKARFMLVNTSGSYNPDAEDGPSLSPLRQVEVKAKVEAEDGAVDSVYVLNLPESLAVGQAVECTLALVLPAGAKPDDYGGWVFISATDSLGFQVQDSFAVVVSSAEPHQSLDSFRVAPIPFKPYQNPEHDAIHFQGLTDGARVIVYDASGQEVWRDTEKGDGHVAWKAEVASGIYVYLVVTADGKASKVGKLSVIR